MPLVKRSIEPVFVSRAQLDQKIKNELEGVTVNSLAGLIKQLSCLSKHAENLFGELFNDANDIFQRTVGLNKSVEKLRDTVVRLDPASQEQVRPEDVYHVDHFKALQDEQQQILGRNTLPAALKEVYDTCTTSPDLNVFNCYRDDGKSGLAFYTDPEYFYNKWVKEEQERIAEKKRNRAERKKHNKRKKDGPKKKIQAAQKKQYAAVDKEFRGEKQEQRNSVVTSDSSPAHVEESVQKQPDIGDGSQEASVAVATPSLPPPPPPPPHSASTSSLPPPPPPPPPPPSLSGGFVPIPPPMPVAPPPPIPSPSQQNLVKPVAPPPPPPPVPGMPPIGPPPTVPQVYIPTPPPPPPPTTAPQFHPPPPLPSVPAALTLPPPESLRHVEKPPPVVDQRSALLKAIEEGKKLRKVERTTDEKKPTTQGTDVASILKRRIAMELSDTESEDDSDSEGEDDWD